MTFLHHLWDWCRGGAKRSWAFAFVLTLLSHSSILLSINPGHVPRRHKAYANGILMIMILRPYGSEDLDEIVQLWYHAWHHTFPFFKHPQPLETWRTRFHDDIAMNETIWVVEQEGRIIGFLALREHDSYLDLLFVDPQFHHQGVGTVLMNKAKQLSPHGLSLHTLQQNQNSRAFYERRGFHAMRLGRNAFSSQPDVEYYWEPEEGETAEYQKHYTVDFS